MLVLRGNIVNRTYVEHKNLYISLFLPTTFGPIYLWSPVIEQYTVVALVVQVGGVVIARKRRGMIDDNIRLESVGYRTGSLVIS